MEEKNKIQISGIIDATNNQTNAINNQTQKIEEQTNAIKENNETNKNIFEKILEVLSYINPLSENFFVYKLIELLLEALKSLFIPHDGFFNEWLDDLNSYFGDAFGILYYPFELLIDFLNRVNSISDSGTAVLKFNDITINFMGYSGTLISRLYI